MSDPKVQGRVSVIEDTKSFGQNGFRKRLVVLEQDKGKFTNYVPVEFTQDRCDAVDELNVGDEVEIMYRLSGRKWQKDPSSEVKYFVNVEALGFHVMGAGPSGGGTPNSASANDAFSEAANDIDDPPF